MFSKPVWINCDMLQCANIMKIGADFVSCFSIPLIDCLPFFSLACCTTLQRSLNIMKLASLLVLGT